MKQTAQTLDHIIFTDKLYNTCKCGETHPLDYYKQGKNEIWLSFCNNCKTLFIAPLTEPRLTLWERFKQIWQ